MKRLKPRERAFWEEYLARLPPARRPKKPFVEAAFAGGREATDGLLDLYRRGKKTAGSSLVEDFKSAGDPPPKVGNYWIILDSKDRPQLLVRTVRIEINRFGGIPASVARAEGEGDLSTAYWKAVHRKAFLPSPAKWGIDDLDRAEVVTEHFEILHGRATSRRAR